jgi:putative ABC transport system substrate-binding protein
MIRLTRRHQMGTFMIPFRSAVSFVFIALFPLPLHAQEIQKPLEDALKDYVALNDGLGLSTLHQAAAKGALETTKKLLELGADPNAGDDRGVAPLHLAALKGQIESAKILLAGGAKINQKDNLGATPVNYAMAGARAECEKFLRERGGKESQEELVKRYFQPGSLGEVEVRFESVPEGADVFVDGEEVCRSTPCKAHLGLGRHRIVMQARWYLRHAAEADVQKDTTVKFELEKKPHTRDVLLVLSKRFALYDRAVEGFKSLFEGSVKQVILADPETLHDLVLKVNPKVILAVGLKAARIAKAKFSNVPIVFCMAVHPLQNGLRTETSTGVHLEPSAADQLLAVTRIIPHVKRIGIIYDPKRTGRLVAEFGDAAAEQEMEIVAVPVGSQAEAQKVLVEMPQKVQALWLIRDATVLNRDFFNRALVLQFEERMPLIAYSPQFVRKGAFFAYSASYQRQGRKAAEIVRALIEGQLPSELEVAYPDGVITFNVKTGEKLQYIMPGLRMLLGGRGGVVEIEDIPGGDQK